MFKRLTVLMGMALVALTIGACSKKSDNNNNGYYNGYNNNYVNAPNSCYVSGGANRYQWLNGQCRDVQQNVNVAQNYCAQAASGYSYDQRCNFYGGYQYYPGYQWSGGNYTYTNAGNACSIYNTAYQQFYPVVLPNRGLVCIGSSTYNYINSYYGVSPFLYGSALRGCYPGSTSCHCRSFGGSLGWIQGGVSIGVCF